MTSTLLERLAHAAGLNGDTIALSPRGISLSYRELLEAVCAASVSLVRSGLKPGERIAILLSNGAEAVIARLAVMAAGGIAVPLPANLSRRQVAHVMDDSRAAWLIVDGTREDGRALALACDGRTRVVWVGERHMSRGGRRVHWDDLLVAPANEAPPPPPPDTPALLQYVPEGRRLRGILTSHAALAACALGVAAAALPGGGERVVQTASFATPFGGAMLHAGLMAGAEVMPRCEAGCVQHLLSVLEAEQATLLVTTAGVIDSVLRRTVLGNYDLERLRGILLAGPGAERVGRQVAGRLAGMPVTAMAIVAEAGGPIAMMRCDADGDGSGTPLPGVELCVGMRGLPDEGPRQGELMLRGPAAMLGYWGGRERGGEWLRTGIAASCDADGTLRMAMSGEAQAGDGRTIKTAGLRA